MPKSKIERRGYIIAPKDPAKAKNYDPETGIYSFESTGKDGKKHTREHVLFSVDITPEDSKYIKMETINLYPRNGYTFTPLEKKNLHPKKGYTIELNKDPEELEERKPGEEKKGYRNFYAKAIYANRDADFQKLGKAYAKQGEEYRASKAAYKEEKEAQKVADAISGLNKQEVVTKEVTLTKDPKLEISEGYGNVLLQRFTAKDGDDKEMSVRIPADINLQSGDTIKLSGIHQQAYTDEETGKERVYLTSLEKNTAELVNRADTTRSPDAKELQGMIGKPREFDGTYTVPLYMQPLTQKEDGKLDYTGNEFLGRAEIPKDLYEALKKETEKGNFNIGIMGTGKPVHEVGIDKKGVAHINSMVDLTKDKDLSVNGVSKSEYLKSLQPKPEKKADKAKAPKKAKTAKKTTER